MNQQTFDDLLQKSRNQATKTLFGGDLQGNTDTYLKPTNLNSQDEVPPPPKAIFREEGATNELDNRMNMLLQPQVPRDPELEALNSYFNQRRVDDFARGSLNQIVGERLQKQAEQNASQIMRDEMDRRAGIRRQVLDMTGLTPAQIDQQLVAESFAGINPRTMDMRERQVQDAVARFYAIQNIPAPATEASINPVPATIPTIAGDTQREDGQTAMIDEDVLPPASTAAPPTIAPARQANYDPDVRELPNTMDAVDSLGKKALISLIINNRIAREDTINMRTGEIKSADTLNSIPLALLRIIVGDEVSRRFGAGGGGGGGAVGNPTL